MPELPADMLAVGVVRATHALEGLVRVESLSGETGHFAHLGEVTLVGDGWLETRRVESVSSSGASVIMKFAGVDRLNDAKALVGAEVWVRRENAAPLGIDEFYYRDLCQCSVTLNGEVVGRVKAISAAAGRDLIEVELNDARLVLVPFQDEFIGLVSLEERLVELKTAWILE